MLGQRELWFLRLLPRTRTDGRFGSLNEPAAAGVRCAERGGAGGKDRANELIEKAMTGPASRPED
jgi:hypothetical protein